MDDARRSYLTGVALLLVVVSLWTASNFITQDVFETGYSKPFFVTYLNTASFTLYLAPFALRSLCARLSRIHAQTNSAFIQGDEYLPVSGAEGTHTPSDGAPQEAADPPLTRRETARLAAVFCVIWFLANWTLNASLEYTTVASSTILASTSGFLTLIVGRLFRVEVLDFVKVLAVMVSFIGVILVTDSDNSTTGGEALPPDSTLKRLPRAIYGDVLALLSAVCYAVYVTLLKVRIGSESRIDMQLFFGFVGLFSVVGFCPLVAVMDWTGLEKFELPYSRLVLLATITNMAITFSSDFIYVIAMLKTTPLLVTIGLSLTIPFAAAGDLVLGHSVAPQALVGASLVLASFIAIGLPRREDLARQTEEPLGAADC